MRVWGSAVAVAAGLLAATSGAHAGGSSNGATNSDFALNDPSYLMVGAGSWEVARDNLRTYELDAALRPDAHLWVIKPQFGLTVAGDGDVLLYAGPLIDYNLTKHWVVSGSTSAGYWTSGGFNLGSHLEFRSGAELAYRWNNGVRLGFGFYHTSNADITRRNPGSESALIEYSIPVKLGF